MVPFFILFLLVSFGSVSAVLFTPALPTIQAFFKVSAGEAQLAVTSYLAGYALGQLPYGPLANGIGRKKTLYVGISLAILGSLFCALSSFVGSFWVLVLARFIQALGACVGLKMSFTIVLDVYDSLTATRMISKFLAAFAIMPGVAIAIGGSLVQWMNWESCFYFLALFGAVMLVFVSRLPETAPSIDIRSLDFLSILEGYRLKLKNKRLLLSGILVGCGTAVIYVFAARAPFIGINLIGMRPDTFGFFNFIPSLGMLIGSFLSTWLVKRYSPFPLLRAGIWICFVLALGMLGLFIFFGPSIWSLFFPIALMYAADALVFTTGSSLGLTSAKNKSNASAIFNFLNIGMALVGVLVSEWVYPEVAVVLPIAAIVLFLAVILLSSSKAFISE